MREKEDKELITVAVAVYNSAEYLEKCLESIRIQTYTNLEVLMVVDGEMRDDSEKICREFEKKDERFSTIKIEHAGLPQVRNVGVENAKGTYIAFIDGDDWIEPDTYKKMYTAISDKKADMAISAYYIEKDGFVYIKGKLGQDEIAPYEMLRGVVSGRLENFMWNKLYRLKLFDGISFLSDKIVDDMSVMHLLVDRCNNIAVVNEPLNHYIKHKGSIISGRNYKMRLDILELLMLQHKFIICKYPELKSDMVENIYDGYIALAMAAIFSKKTERNKYINFRNELRNYYSGYKNDFEYNLRYMEYKILQMIWKNIFINDIFAIGWEALNRFIFSGKVKKI